MSRRTPVSSRLAVTTAAALAVALASGWGTVAAASAPPAGPARPLVPMAKKVKPRPGPLSGKWTGSYSGSFSGTFKLNWVELGKHLSGIIRISGFKNAPTSIHGNVRGSSISFGTVGSQAITYSGSVSGTSMSGTWTIKAGGRAMGGGSWKASQS
jgi:hypothetical protein